MFDPYRTSGLANAGWVACDTVRNSAGIVVADRYSADLPDTGFLFPGDILHYYISATEELGGATSTTFLPADTTGFSDFDNVLGYDSSFTVRALPTVMAIDGGNAEVPRVLFWNDFANRGGQDEWHGALANIGMQPGRDYDVYYTNGPTSGVGNGLGGRATVEQLAAYDILLYTAGDLSINTISNGDFNNDPSADADLIDQWLRLGGKHAFLTGDDLAADLAGAGPITSAFLQDDMGLVLVAEDLRPLIGGQSTPRVRTTEAAVDVFTRVSSWIAYGGCGGLNTFDAVTPAGGAVALAEFTDPAGNTSVYPYAAATLNTMAGGSLVISLPCDLMFVHTDPDEGTKAQANLAARARILYDVLARFGRIDFGGETGVPDAGVFSAAVRPNPFNANARIDYMLPTAGRLTIKVFDLRGRLVRVLLDERQEAGPGAVAWRGEDAQGAAVASGVYFYELRHGGDVRIGRMTLVK